MEQAVHVIQLQLLSVGEVARRLNVPVRTVRRRIASGEISIHRIGRAVRISEADLAMYIRQTRDSTL